MSGFHQHPSADGHHHHHGNDDHHNDPPTMHARSRRAFLGDFGRGTLALAVFTPILAACGGDDAGDDDTSADDTSADDTSGSTEASRASGTEDDQAGSTTERSAAVGDDQALRWGRTRIGSVSAYVLARGNTAAIVDTGNPGSAEAIGRSLADLGLNYGDVGHVLLTHHHPDHVGSIDAVLGNATSATVYAGEADLGSIDVTAGGEPVNESRIVALRGGEDIFGFEALATPGHTDGHIAAIDHTAGLLVAGDAIFTEGDRVVEGPERFFKDVPRSRESITLLAALSYNTLLVGHGDPIETGADAAVAALAATL